MEGVTTKEGWIDLCQYRLPIQFKFGIRYGLITCRHKLYVGNYKGGIFIPEQSSFRYTNKKLVCKNKHRMKVVKVTDQKLVCLWYRDELNFTRVNIYRSEIKSVELGHPNGGTIVCNRCLTK
jgi:hypothetical protein